MDEGREALDIFVGTATSHPRPRSGCSLVGFAVLGVLLAMAALGALFLIVWGAIWAFSMLSFPSLPTAL
jgi:hypothetical protein